MEFIDVNKELPKRKGDEKYSETVIVLHADGEIGTGNYFFDEEAWDGNYKPTHWMPKEAIKLPQASAPVMTNKDNKITLVISKCGDNSILGALMKNATSSGIIKADGLKEFRNKLQDSSLQIIVSCRISDNDNVVRQLQELNLRHWTIIHNFDTADKQSKSSILKQLIALSTAYKSSLNNLGDFKTVFDIEETIKSANTWLEELE